MPELLTVALLALLPPAGNFAGGLLAESLPVTDRWLNRALHAAAGVVIAVVAFEIFPEALDVAAPWVLAVAFLAGGLLYMVAQGLIQGAAGEEGEGTSRMWMIYLAVATDLFGDGLLLGAGASVSAGLGLALALGQVSPTSPRVSPPSSRSGRTASRGGAGFCSQRPSSFRRCWGRRSRTRYCEAPAKPFSTRRSW